MSWKREGDRVTVDMSIDDWEILLMRLGFSIGATHASGWDREVIGFVNRLNDGNPGFAPYVMPRDPGRAR